MLCELPIFMVWKFIMIDRLLSFLDFTDTFYKECRSYFFSPLALLICILVYNVAPLLFGVCEYRYVFVCMYNQNAHYIVL